MTAHEIVTQAHLEDLRSPLSIDELHQLKLPADSLRRLYYLLESRRLGTLSSIEKAQLDAFYQAAFYLHAGEGHVA